MQSLIHARAISTTLRLALAALLGGCLAACITPPKNPNATTGDAAPPKNRKTPVARYGQLSVEDAQLSSSSGEPVVLRGKAFGWDNWWPQYYNADVVRWLRDDWCVDIVRPAMGIEPDGAYLSNGAASKQRITTVVDAAIDLGVYVIIDWHAHNLHQPEAVAFFTEMAERYGKHPHVLYEIFNEPEKDETWQQVKDYATAVISAIRRHDPDNIVIVGSPEWDQRIDTVAADPLTAQTNVMYSVHFYAGTHGQWLRDRTFSAIRAGIPVIVSESSGAEASGQGKNNYAEWQAWIDFMETNRVSWLNYSVSDKAGETISVLHPGATASGGWTDAELTESGKFVRKLLRTHCN
jgi:endoglucanase